MHAGDVTPLQGSAFMQACAQGDAPGQACSGSRLGGACTAGAGVGAQHGAQAGRAGQLRGPGQVLLLLLVLLLAAALWQALHASHSPSPPECVTEHRSCMLIEHTH
jgi:hypothetical protein